MTTYSTIARRIAFVAVLTLAVAPLAACGGETIDAVASASAGESVTETAQATVAVTPHASEMGVASPRAASSSAAPIPDVWAAMPSGEENVTELNFERDGLTIRGDLHVPSNLANEETYPVVIWSHGFGGSRTYDLGYIDKLVSAGLAVYAFDFCGGGPSSDSDGDMQHMSVLTEKADLEAVLAGIRSQPWCDGRNVFLMGESQGGFVSAITAADHADEIAAMVLFYPAFVIPDDALAAYPNAADVPDTYSIMGMTIGRVYYEDALKTDIWNVIGNYSGDVLIEHGTADTIVPYSYSERAAGIYPHATLIPIDGAGHGFYGSDQAAAIANAVSFIRSHFV